MLWQCYPSTYCIYIWPHFSPYLTIFSRCFHDEFRWEMVKFNSFESYRAYNVFHHTFRRDSWVLIERKTLGVNWRKIGDLTKSRALDNEEPEEAKEARSRCRVHTVVWPLQEGGTASQCPVARLCHPSRAGRAFGHRCALLPSAPLVCFSVFISGCTFLSKKRPFCWVL